MTQFEENAYNSASDQECAEFQAGMAERVSSGQDLQDHPHLLTCSRCSALVSDLEAIANAAKLLMPIDAEPGDDLWSKIESKLALESRGDGEANSADRNDNMTNLALEDGLALEGGIA